jgi:hypothetical protein
VEKYSPDWKTIKAFISELNQFIQKYSEFEIQDKNSTQTLYPLLTVDNWILFEPLKSSKSEIIGFRCRTYNYLIQPMKEADAIKIYNVKLIKLIYSPYDINNILRKNQPAIKDARSEKITSSLYDNYLYPILIIELINIMDKQRNIAIRKKLTSIFEKITIHDHRYKELSDLLKEYPEDYKNIRRIISDNLNTDIKNRTSFEHFVNKKALSKSDLISLIDNSVFNFDKKIFDKLRQMDYTSLLKELTDIFEKITVDKQPDLDDEFPNMIMSCEVNSLYCDGKKVMIKKNKLKKILEVMAADILNPVKSSYIFNPIFVKNTVDYFKFIVRKNEHISITV